MNFNVTLSSRVESVHVNLCLEHNIRVVHRCNFTISPIPQFDPNSIRGLSCSSRSPSRTRQSTVIRMFLSSFDGRDILLRASSTASYFIPRTSISKQIQRPVHHRRERQRHNTTQHRAGSTPSCYIWQCQKDSSRSVSLFVGQ